MLFPFFRSVLLEQRKFFLFPKVWNILWNQRESCAVNLLSDSDLFQLRLVCRAWCSAIDQKIANHCSLTKFFEDPYPRTEASFKQQNCRMLAHVSEEYLCTRTMIHDEIDRLEKFLTTFEATHPGENNRSPFIGGNVLIYYDRAGRERDFGLLKTVLSKYGKFIRHCTLIGVTNITPVDYYLKTRELLLLLPNVKSLTLRFRGRNINQEHALVRKMSENPLPYCQQLRFLSTINLHAPFLTGLLRNHELQLNMLSVHQIQGNEPVQIYNLHLLEMPNLRQVSLSCFSSAEYFNLRQATWPLTRIHLDLSSCQGVVWAQLCDTLEKWADSLTDLYIKFPRPADEQTLHEFLINSYTYRLNLPAVKRLSLVFWSIHYLDFILPMQNSLEYLDVCVYWDMFTDYEIPHAQKIDFMGYFDRLERNPNLIFESNIWTLFPNISRVDVYDQWTFRLGDEDQMCVHLDEFTGREDGKSRQQWRDYMKSRVVNY